MRVKWASRSGARHTFEITKVDAAECLTAGPCSSCCCMSSADFTLNYSHSTSCTGKKEAVGTLLMAFLGKEQGCQRATTEDTLLQVHSYSVCVNDQALSKCSTATLNAYNCLWPFLCGNIKARASDSREFYVARKACLTDYQ